MSNVLFRLLSAWLTISCALWLIPADFGHPCQHPFINGGILLGVWCGLDLLRRTD
jgi:hypothetical protein